MWCNLAKRCFVVIAIFFFLLLLRKTILSFDVRILYWLLNDVKFPDYEGHVKGFLGLGEIDYKLTGMKLSGIRVEHSNMDISNLGELTHTGTRYFNVTFHNGNANFYANWSYTAWPSIADNGSMTLDMSNVYLQFGVEIYSNNQGLVNFTSSKCIVKIERVDLKFYHDLNLRYDSMKASIQTEAENSLPETLCGALRNGLLKHVSFSIQNAQRKFVNFTLSGDVKDREHLIGTLGWILVYMLVIPVKFIHDFGVTLLTMLAFFSIYLLFVVLKCIIPVLKAILFRQRKTRKRSRSDPEPYEQDKPVLLYTVPVTIVSTNSEMAERRSTMIAKFTKLLWWRKPKEN